MQDLRGLRWHRGKIAARGNRQVGAAAPLAGAPSARSTQSNQALAVAGRPFRDGARPDMNRRSINWFKRAAETHRAFGETHGSQDEFPRLLYRLGDAVQEWRAR